MRELDDLTAADLMTEDPITVDDRARVRAALDILQTLDIRHLPVVDRAGALVGMVSDRDLRSAHAPSTVQSANGSTLSVLERSITEIMSSDVTAVSPASSLAEILDLLLELKVGALPVVEEDGGELVGILSYVDVLRAVRRSIA